MVLLRLQGRAGPQHSMAFGFAGTRDEPWGQGLALQWCHMLPGELCCDIEVLTLHDKTRLRRRSFMGAYGRLRLLFSMHVAFCVHGKRVNIAQPAACLAGGAALSL